jgi:DHA3 family macrolide efflux protein-like MFS transporter
MNIAAPILGAFLLALIPLHSVLSVDLLTAALAILPLLFINIPQPKREESPDQIKTSVLGDIRDGFRYVWNWIGLRNVIFIAVTVNLVTIPAITLMPLLVKNEFSGGVMEVASMQSALAVGFLVGGVLLSVWGGFKRKIRTTTMGMFGTALGLLVVGLAHTVAFQLALAGIFIAGLMNVIVNGPAIALLQTLVAEDMQGRVLSLVISLANAMTPLGLLFAGPLADRTGVNMMFILASLIFVISGIFTLVNAPLRNIETNHRDEAREQESTTSALGTT